MRTRDDDRRDLILLGIEAILIALDDGYGHYAPGSWMCQTEANHVAHVRVHLDNVECPRYGDVEHHETHLICRGTILYALRNPLTPERRRALFCELRRLLSPNLE